ncbi:MAG: hypothetical protein WJ306_05300 [Ferrovum myxofaciens]
MSDQNGKVTFRYQNSKTKQWESRTLSGVEISAQNPAAYSPEGISDEARNFGFLHPNSRLVKLVQLIKRVFVPPPKPRPVPGCPMLRKTDAHRCVRG